MTYAELDINQKINAKNNAEVFYTTYQRGFRERLPYGDLIVKRIRFRNADLFIPQRMFKA